MTPNDRLAQRTRGRQLIRRITVSTAIGAAAITAGLAGVFAVDNATAGTSTTDSDTSTTTTTNGSDDSGSGSSSSGSYGSDAPSHSDQGSGQTTTSGS